MEIDAEPQGGSHLPSSSQDLLLLIQSPVPPRLAQPVIQEGLDYLRNPVAAESSENPAAEYFNNVIGLLLTQGNAEVGLSQVLLEVVGNERQSLLLRDYAMQHFWHVWNREKNPAMKREIEARLKANFEASHSPLQAVALLTASRLFGPRTAIKGPNGEKLVPIGEARVNPLAVSKPTLFSEEEFTSTALKIAIDSTSSSNARACAFNALLQLEVSQSVYGAREVLKEPKAPDEVRCAAIATIGAFGDPASDLEMLNSVPPQPESVRAAAEHALAKLKHSHPVH